MDAVIQLRDYQSVAAHQVFQAWRDGYRSVVLVSPTGSGKRVFALWLMKLSADAGRRVLFIGNRRLLIHQAASDAEKYAVPFGTIMADCLEGDAGSTNQIASLQTIESRYLEHDWDREAGQGLPEANLIIIDEAHAHLASYQELLAFYPESKILLLTATPIGPGGRSLVPIPYDRLIEGVKNSELIAAGHLRRTRVIAPSEPNLQGIKLEKISDEKLGKVVHSCTLFADLFNEWAPFADRRTVVFAPGVSYGGGLASDFNRRLGAGQAHLIHAKTKPAERQRVFESLREGTSKLVVSVGVLREGWDEPCVSCGIDVQPRSQMRDYWQKVGRVKRPFTGIKDAIWIDMAGDVWRHGIHPDENPEWPIGDQDTIKKIKQRREMKEQSLIICPKCKCERRGGLKCPECGFQWEASLRWIRMGNGKLKQISAHEVKKTQKTESERLFAKWQGRLFGALKSGATYGQARNIFYRETGQYPKNGWPGVFHPESVNWKLKPCQEHSMRSLAIACRQCQK